MVKIERLDAAQAQLALPALVEILQDAVASGASVGFLPPLSAADAEAFWRGVISAVREQSRILLAARTEQGIVGAVQLIPASYPNGRHRAEVAKLLVHRSARRRGIGRALMAALEQAAREDGRTLLVLDTCRGDFGELLYRALGYSEAGSIPNFAQVAGGAYCETILFYRHIG